MVTVKQLSTLKLATNIFVCHVSQIQSVQTVSGMERRYATTGEMGLEDPRLMP